MRDVSELYELDTNRYRLEARVGYQHVETQKVVQRQYGEERKLLYHNRLFEQDGKDQDAFAKVPVVFNGKHPKHPNCVFLPVIVSLGPVEKKNSGESEQWIQIDYLDVERFVPVVEEYKKKMSHPTSPSPQ